MKVDEELRSMDKDEEILWEEEGQEGVVRVWVLKTKHILLAKIEPDQSLSLRKKMKTQRIISVIFNGLFIHSSDQH